jgi:putative ABC transport system permease protein
MRPLATTVALLRRSRVERGVLALLFVLVAVTSFVVTAGPRLLSRVADDGLRYEVRAAPPAARNLQFQAVGELPGQVGDALARVRARGDEIWGQLPPGVQKVVAERGSVVDSVRFRLTDPPNYETLVAMTYQDGVEDLVRYVEGRAPVALGSPPDGSDDPRRFEVALSRAAAAEIQVGVGSRLPATADPSDPLLRRVFPRPTTPVVFEVVGLFDVPDPGAPGFFGESRLAQAAIGGSEEHPVAFATALIAPEAYLDLRAVGMPAQYRWRFFTDVDRLDVGRLATLVPDLRRLDATFGSTTGTPGDLTYRSGLLELVDRFSRRRATTEATLAVAAIGPLAVAAGAVGLVAMIIVRRRRSALLLARGRGASSRQLLAAQVLEGLLVCLPAALVGMLVAIALVPARGDVRVVLGAGGVAVAATALLVAATWPLARRARRDLEREDRPVRGPSPRRLVLEATAVGVAIVAAWLLRERSVTATLADGSSSGFDPFLAAAPVLIGIAVGLLALRLYPVPVRLLAAVASRRRDLVPVLGLRSIGRHPSAAYLPLLVLTLTVAIGVFSAVVSATIEGGQSAATWQQVGADYRIDAPSGGSLDPAVIELAGAGIPGITASATALGLDVSPPTDRSGSSTDTRLHAIDPVAYVAVIAGSPAAIGIPAVFADPPPADVGTESAPIPAVVSTRLPNGWEPRAVGDTFALQVRGESLWFVIDRIVDHFPGLRTSRSFVIAPLPSVVAAHHQSVLRPSTVFLRAPAEAGEGLAAGLAATGRSGVLTSRHAAYAALHDAPLVGAVGRGFVVALAVAAGYAALAVVAVIALDATRRARESAFLRTLGLTDRQLVGLTVVEHAPPVTLALLIGVGLGLGVAWLLAPGLELAVFIDPGAPVVLQVDWGTVIVVVVAIVLVVAVAIGASSWLGRRLDASQALRIGEA